MTKYIRYLFEVLKRKISIYVTAAISFAVIAGIMISTLLQERTVALATFLNSGAFSMVTIVFFAFSLLFMTFVSATIFKEGEDNGTELLICSKHLRRWEIITGKFIVLYVCIFIYSVAFFVFMFSIFYFDSEFRDIPRDLKTAGSWSLGQGIIMTLFSSIMAFFASILSRIWTLVLSLLIPLIFPLMSAITINFGYGNGNRLSVVPTKIKLLDNDTLNVTNDFKNVLGYRAINPITWDADWQKYKKGFYKNFAPIDIWNHLNRFYSILTEDKNESIDLRKNGIKWERETLKLSNDHYFGIYLPGSFRSKSYYVLNLGNSSIFNFVDDKNNEVTIETINKEHLKKIIKNHPDEIGHIWPNAKDEKTLSKIILDLNNYINDDSSADKDFINELKKTIGFSTERSNNKKLMFLYMYLHKNYNDLNIEEDMIPNVKEKEKPNNKERDNFNGYNAYGLLEVNEYPVLKGTPFIKKNDILIAYSLITVILAIGVFLRYFRKDFK